MIPPAVGMALVIVVLGLMMQIVHAGQRKFQLEAELSRKSVHVGMGLVCLSFPWLFHQAWVVWVLAGCAFLALLAVRCLPVLKNRLGQVIGGVERESWGELMFPLAVAFVFWLSQGVALLFCVPVLILTFADATAALVGRRYGYARYKTDDGWKTIEGSAAFFAVAFVTTAIPFWVFGQLGHAESLIIACVMGFILALIEAIAWRGLDNLLIPVVSYVCLVRMIKMPAPDLVARLAVLLLVIGGLFFWRKATRLTQSALIGAALIIYVTWAAGDWHWLIAPVVVAAGYTYLCLQPRLARHRHTVHAIACIGGVGLCWLCVWCVVGNQHAVYAYGISYAANFGMIILPFTIKRSASRSASSGISDAVALSYLLLAVPYLIVWHAHPMVIWMALGALGLVIAALGVFAAWQPSLESSPMDAERWTRQGVISAFVSALAFGFAMYLDS